MRGGKKYERGARLHANHPSSGCDSTRPEERQGNRLKQVYAVTESRNQVVVAVAVQRDLAYPTM